MKKMVLLLLLPLLLAAGCSLTDADAQASGSAQLRLLTGTGEPTTLSHPDYDDWSPQMVNWGGRKYLYFLSKRQYNGLGLQEGPNGWDSSFPKAEGITGVFRAEEVKPGEYSNLRLFYVLGDVTVPAIAVVSNADLPLWPHVWYSKDNGESLEIWRLDHVANSMPGSVSFEYSGYNYLGGSWVTDSGGHRIYLGTRQTAVREFESVGYPIPFTALVFKANYNGDNFEGNAIMQIEPDLADVLEPWKGLFFRDQQYLQNFDVYNFNKSLLYRGSTPAVFTTDGMDMCFGFYVSLGGRLLQLVYPGCSDYLAWEGNSNYWDLYSIVGEPDLLVQIQRLVPLLSLTHYAGTIDKDPAYDQRNGNLFFASDRAGQGNFDLYYVPQEYLRIPAGIIPADIQQPQP